MTSRQRLLDTLSGTIPDRVPISTYELVGCNSRSFENREPSYQRLMDFIRTHTDCICMWNPGSNQTFAQSAVELEVDVVQEREGTRHIRHETVQTPEGPLQRTQVTMDGLYTVWKTEKLCKTPADFDKLLSIPYRPVQYDFSDYARIQREVGQNGIIMASLSDPLGLAAGTMDFADFTIWAVTEPDHFARTLAKLHERNMENLKAMLKEQVLDLYRICGPEYATPPYLPPSYFRQYVTPFVTAMTSLIHEKGGRVRLHSHGRIGQVVESIAAAGVDGLDPCEAPPDGDITLEALKQQIGDRVCLFGNLQLKLLDCGDCADVRRQVKHCMAAAKAGGRYVIMPTAAPISTPLPRKTEENYMAFIEAALSLGTY